MKLFRSLMTPLLAFCAVRSAGGAPLTLVRGGRADHVIVTAADATAVDRYAAEKLALYLGQITGAEFLVKPSAELAPDAHALFVGLSASALERLGEADPLEGLADQEHVARSVGPDIFLYGRGVHGTLHAALLFLENALGWRWYSVYEKPVVPAAPAVLAPFHWKRGFSFSSRELTRFWNEDFYYQNGMNMCSEKWGRHPGSPFVPFLRNDKFVHSLFAYLPPSPDSPYVRPDFTWLPRTNYFETNPDFFSMDPYGKRVSGRQLCFGNPALRQELTGNVLRHIAAEPGNRIITVDANDTPDTFCYCPACKALEVR